jgi:DNA-binding transcriptional MerR regulator
MKFSQILSEKVDYSEEMRSEERRENKEWELGPDCPLEGRKAWALLYYLEYENEIEVLTPEDLENKKKISEKIEELNQTYNKTDDKDEQDDLLNEISDLEDELDEFDDKVDVYDLIPNGDYYDMTQFEIPKVTSKTYAVGTENEVQSSAEEYVSQLIDDIGYGGFRSGFMENYIDEDKVIEEFRNIFEEDISNNPESYFEDDDRELSPQQEERIEIFNEKISKVKEFISLLEKSLTGDDDVDESVQEKIDELQEEIEEMEQEIYEIENSPEGDFPEHLFDRAIEIKMNDIKRNPIDYMNDYGMEYENYIDRDKFIEGVIDEDGYEMLSSYDGQMDEREVLGQYFWICRID